MRDTVDERSLKDGYSPEAIVTGEACGRQYMVTVRMAYYELTKLLYPHIV